MSALRVVVRGMGSYFEALMQHLMLVQTLGRFLVFARFPQACVSKSLKPSE